MARSILKSKPKRGLTPLSTTPSLFEEAEPFGSLWDWFQNQRPGLWTSGQTGLTVSEDQKNFYVEAKMPGCDIGDIHVTYDNGTLDIHGERCEEECEGRRYYSKESCNYNYRLNLPSSVDAAKQNATYKNGVLSINFQKHKQSQGSSIEVRKG